MHANVLTMQKIKWRSATSPQNNILFECSLSSVLKEFHQWVGFNEMVKKKALQVYLLRMTFILTSLLTIAIWVYWMFATPVIYLFFEIVLLIRPLALASDLKQYELGWLCWWHFYFLCILSHIPSVVKGIASHILYTASKCFIILQFSHSLYLL